MKKQSKENWGLALAAAGLAAMILLQKGSADSGLSGSGGGLAGDTGLPPISGSGGGGQESPVINIDFPAPQPFNFPFGPEPNPAPGPGPEVSPTPEGTTKKEQVIDASKVPPWELAGMSWQMVKDPSNPNMTSQDIENLPYFLDAKSGIDTTKKEQKKEVAPWGISLLNPVYDLAVGLGYGSRSGYKTTAEMQSPVVTTKKSASIGSSSSLPRDEPSRTSSPSTSYAGGFSFGSSPMPSFTSSKIASAVERYGSSRYSRPSYAPTKKESSTGRPGGSGGSGMTPPSNNNSYWSFS